MKNLITSIFIIMVLVFSSCSNQGKNEAAKEEIIQTEKKIEELDNVAKELDDAVNELEESLNGL